MVYKIKILNKLDNCIFGEYEAEYLGEQKEVVGVSEVVDKIPKIQLNPGDKITVDSKCVCELRDEIECTGLLSIFAQNIQRGCVLTITKILIQNDNI